MAVQTTPYQTAQDALNIAITASNDGNGPNGMAGNVLNPTSNPQVLPSFQNNWVYLQQRLISCGVDTFTKTQPVFNLGASMNNNPRVNMQLTYNGYFNGVVWTGPNITAPAWDSSVTYMQGMTVTFGDAYYVALPNSGTNLNQEPDTATIFWAPFSNIGPCLPADLVKPLEISESPAGQNYWVPMVQAPDSLNNTWNVQQRFGRWIFEHDRLVLPACSRANDILIKYLAMAPPISSWNSPLMVQGCARALAFLVLYDLSGGRGGEMAESYKAKAEEAINQILNQTVRKMAYSSFVRRPFRSPRNGGRRSGL
jgi:hypothetical protein